MRSVEAYRNVGKADYLFLKDEPATPGVTGRFPFNKEANQLNYRSFGFYPLQRKKPHLSMRLSSLCWRSGRDSNPRPPA
ncbi:protein of unknown function [Shewanella benthica]|uniref:Uncharacterized protein n=1 Tax=Shewanella benthica TaxID=43661 RepID=A0A330M3S9_9GAMM|nr:protein of unknown function [Shewanella benthica]